MIGSDAITSTATGSAATHRENPHQLNHESCGAADEEDFVNDLKSCDWKKYYKL